MEATLELLIATNAGEVYKKRLAEMFPQQRFGTSGWMAVRALPYVDAAFKKQVEDAVKVYVPQLDKDLAQTPFGVPTVKTGQSCNDRVLANRRIARHVRFEPRDLWLKVTASR